MQVYHVDKLQNPSRKSLGGFRGVVIVGPTSENMRLLRQELAEAKLDEYHLFFTNTIHDHHVQDLARCDLSQVQSTGAYIVPFCPARSLAGSVYVGDYSKHICDRWCGKYRKCI